MSHSAPPLAVVATLLMSLSAVAGCTSNQPATPPSTPVRAGSADSQASRAATLSSVRLGINKLGAMTNVWLAQKNGIFNKHGLDVEIVEISSPAQSIPALQSKSVDIVLQIPGTAMVAKEQGFDIALLGQNETAGTTPPVSNALLVPPNSSMNALTDLTGKTIGVSSLRGQSYAALKMLLQRAGVPVEGVQLVEAPFTAHADLLRSRQVDAVVALDPYTTQIIKAGYGRPLSWYMVETIKDQPVGSWWALRPWVREHPGEITAFNAAVKDAMVYLNDDPARAKALIAEYAGLDADLVKDMPLISWKSEIDRPVWQAVADMLHEQGELQRRHDISEYFEA